MAHDADLIEVIHTGPAEVPVRNGESGGLDDMGLDAKAGAQAQNRPRVLRNVGLVKDDAHRKRPRNPGGQCWKNHSGGRF